MGKLYGGQESSRNGLRKLPSKASRDRALGFAALSVSDLHPGGCKYRLVMDASWMMQSRARHVLLIVLPSKISSRFAVKNSSKSSSFSCPSTGSWPLCICSYEISVTYIARYTRRRLSKRRYSFHGRSPTNRYFESYDGSHMPDVYRILCSTWSSAVMWRVYC